MTNSESASSYNSGPSRQILNAPLTYAPLASVTAVAVVSVFNIGYFSKIGLHFIGVVDISNFAYSAALIFTSLILLMNFVASLSGIEWIETFAKRPDVVATMRRWTFAYVLPIVVLACLSSLLVPARYKPDFIASSGYFSFLFAVSFAWMTFFSYIFFQQNLFRPGRHLSAPLSFLILAVFYGGRETATNNAFKSYDKYMVVTRDTQIQHVRLIRTSSLGVLLSLDGTIVYLPKEEIKQIVSEEPISRSGP